jgi:rhodanese-related sulfurtransferase
MRNPKEIALVFCLTAFAHLGCGSLLDENGGDDQGAGTASSADVLCANPCRTENCRGGDPDKPSGGDDPAFATCKPISDRSGCFFASTNGDHTVFATELKQQLDSGASLFVLDVRDASTFGSGHISGSVNVPLDTLFTQSGLTRLPTDGRPVVVVSEDGQAASMAVGALGTLGFNAYALRFGMIGWNRSTPTQVYSASQAPQTIGGLGAPLER